MCQWKENWTEKKQSGRSHFDRKSTQPGDQLTIKADRNCSFQCIHVHKESHQHQCDPVALVVHLQKNKLDGCDTAMNKIWSLPTTQGGLFVKKT